MKPKNKKKKNYGIMRKESDKKKYKIMIQSKQMIQKNK